MQRYDYSSFSLKKINTPEFKHIWLLLYWPLFGIGFWTLERGLNLNYHAVSCALDAKIPFNEFFVIPYYFWFVFLIGMSVYSFFYDVPTFKRFMKYVIITYTATLIIYVIYPTSQELRPPEFTRHNIFTGVVKFLYGFDTNTNVCPSLHVIGSAAVYFAARKSKLFSPFKRRLAFFIMTVLICLSTVFLKQHSIVDVAAGAAMSLLAYPLVYSKKELAKAVYAEPAYN